LEGAGLLQRAGGVGRAEEGAHEFIDGVGEQILRRVFAIVHEAAFGGDGGGANDLAGVGGNEVDLEIEFVADARPFGGAIFPFEDGGVRDELTVHAARGDEAFFECFGTFRCDGGTGLALKRLLQCEGGAPAGIGHGVLFVNRIIWHGDVYA